MKKRVVSILASIALFASAFFVFPAVSPVLAGGAGSPLTQEHPQAIHVWYERDPGLNEGTAYATYKMAIKPYTYAEGDKLVFDVYTDSDYDPQGTPSAKEECPIAGICRGTEWNFFGDGLYVNWQQGSDGSAFRTWKHIEAEVMAPYRTDGAGNPVTLTEISLSAAMYIQDTIRRADAYFDNIKIVDSTGAVKQTIFDSSTDASAVTFQLVESKSAKAHGAQVEKGTGTEAGDSPFTTEHPQAIHVWFERDPALDLGTAFSTYKFAVNGYTYAAGDKLVYDVYTDSDYDTQSRPTENDKFPVAGVGSAGRCNFFGDGLYVNWQQGSDGSAFRGWKHIEAAVPEQFVELELSAGMYATQRVITRADAYFDNIKIVDSTGAVKQILFDSTTSVDSIAFSHTAGESEKGHGAQVENKDGVVGGEPDDDILSTRHPQVIHVWVESDPTSTATPNSTYKFGVSGYTYAEGDVLAYDIYTDSNLEEGAAPQNDKELPTAGISSAGDVKYFADEHYVNWQKGADAAGSAFRKWKSIKVPAKPFTELELTAAMYSSNTQTAITRADIYFDNIRILDANGRVKHTIFDATTLLTHSEGDNEKEHGGQIERKEDADADSPLTDKNTQAIHVWIDKGETEASPFSAYRLAVNGYTYAEGDRLVYDIYTDSDYPAGKTPERVEELPTAGLSSGAIWQFFADKHYVNWQKGADAEGSAFRKWKHIEAAVPQQFTEIKLTAAMYSSVSQNAITRADAYFDNIRILDKDGNVKYTIFDASTLLTHVKGENEKEHGAKVETGLGEDVALAEAVVAQIDALPPFDELTLEDEGAVVAAREAYDALPPSLQRLVTNLSVLTAAESRIYDLKNPIGDFTPKDNYTEFRVQYMDDPGLALKFSAKYALISLPKPDRTVRLATGDQLIYELWMDTKTPGGLIDIMTTDGQRAYTNGYWTANDGGYLLDADFTGRAYMRWHERIVTLQEGIDGKELDSLWLATQTKVEEDGLYMAARYRNIRIVDKNGKLKYAFDSSQYYFDNEGKNGAFIQRNEDGSQPSVASFVVSNWHADDTRVPNPDGETPPLPLLSPVAEIGNLTINGTSASVNGNTLIIRLPKGTVVTALSPVFQLSKGATIDKTGAQNFTNPVKYTVTSEDGKTKKAYTIKVLLVENSGSVEGEPYIEFRAKFQGDPDLQMGYPAKYGLITMEPPSEEIIIEEGDMLTYDVRLGTRMSGIGYLGAITDVTRTHVADVIMTDFRRGLGVDLTDDAYMKWYSRTMIFTDEFEGQKFLGVEATATISPNNEEAAYLSCMYRNIKLVDANGEVKWEFDCDRYYYDGSGRYGSYIEQNSYGTIKPSIEKFTLATYHADGSRIMNPDGLTEEVTLLSDETQIASAEIKGSVATIFSGSTIRILLPEGTDFSSLEPQLVLPIGATVDKTGPQDFSKGAVTYTVTAEDGVTTKAYSIVTEEDIIYEYDPDGGNNKPAPGPDDDTDTPDTGEKGTYAICILLLGGSLLLGILSSRKLKKAKNH